MNLCGKLENYIKSKFNKLVVNMQELYKMQFLFLYLAYKKNSLTILNKYSIITKVVT